MKALLQPSCITHIHCKTGSRIALKEPLSEVEKKILAKLNADTHTAVTVQPAAFVSNGPKTNLFSFFTSHETPDIHTDHCLSAVAHCNHLHSLLGISIVREWVWFFFGGGGGGSQKNGELLNTVFHWEQSLNGQQGPLLPQCLLPLLFLSYNMSLENTVCSANDSRSIFYPI